MLYQLLEDLRFVIGALFAILSVILLIVGYTNPQTTPNGINLNLFSGCTMGMFSIFMLGLSLFAANREKTKETTSNKAKSKIMTSLT